MRVFKVGYKKHGQWAYKWFDTWEDLLGELEFMILTCEKVTIKSLEHVELKGDYRV